MRMKISQCKLYMEAEEKSARFYHTTHCSTYYYYVFPQFVQIKILFLSFEEILDFGLIESLKQMILK